VPLRLGKEIQEMLRRGDGELTSSIKHRSAPHSMKVLHVAVQQDIRRSTEQRINARLLRTTKLERGWALGLR
jgi:hypothetical protein